MLFVLAREDEDGDEEDDLQMQPECAASLAGFPSPDDAPDVIGDASDEWETDEGEDDDVDAEGGQVCFGQPSSAGLPCQHG